MRATWPAHLILFDCPNNNRILDEADLVLVHAKKAYRGSKGTAPSILNVGTRRMYVNFTLQLLYPRGRITLLIE
jgi:hypothetical protein